MKFSLSHIMKLANKYHKNPKKNPRGGNHFVIDWTKDKKHHVIDAYYLGEGAWTTAFYGSDGFVYLATMIQKTKSENDLSKMWLSKFNEVYKNVKHIPKIEYLTTTSMEWGKARIKTKVRLYRSELYEPITEKFLKTECQLEYLAKAITKYLNESWTNGTIKTWNADTVAHLMTIMFKDANRIEEPGRQFDSVIKSLKKLVGFLVQNKVHFMVEFPKQNLAVNKKGELILLDVFYTYGA